MLQQEKKYLSGGINADDAPFAVGEAELINAVNHRFGSSEDGAIGYNESVPGCARIINGALPTPYSNNTPIGSAKDEVKNRWIVFYHNHAGDHSIFCYEVDTGTIRPVLFSSHLIGGLGFTLNNRINEAFVINGKVYWTDNNQQPRCLNIEAGLKFENPSYNTDVAPYQVGLNQTNVTLIRKTANNTLSIRKIQSIDVPALASFTQNFIADGAFQFAIRYLYRDDEGSVLSAWSKIASYGYPNESSTLNAIEIIFTEAIQQDVFAIELVVRFGNTGKAFVIKTWDRNRDAAVIATNSFLHYFLNDGTGTPINDVEANKPFDSIPLKAKALCLVKNRLFLGNSLYGYTAPNSTSLSLTLKTFPVSGGELGTWHYFKVTSLIFGNPGAKQNFAYVIYIDFGGTGPERYGYVKSIDLLFSNHIGVNNNPVGGGLPTLVNEPSTFVPPGVLYTPDITTRVGSLALVEFNARSKTPEFTDPYNQFSVTDQHSTPYPVLVSAKQTSSSGIRALKSDSSYRVGIVFYDEYRRKCGVVTNDGLKQITPARSTVTSAYNYLLQWQLSNTNALNEIPVWAYYYSIVRTKNLVYQSFFQGTPSDATYVTKDADGAFVLNTNTYAITHYGIALRLTSLISQGIGYTYSEGDFANLYTVVPPDPIKKLNVIGQYGDWIILSLVDAGNLTELSPLFFEIYTPYKESITETYYEIGETYPVANPTTVNRTYSALSGSINGDTYGITRGGGNVGIFVTEAMSPNDRYWKNWHSDIGWVNIVDRIGQQRRPNSVAWSNVLIPGTKSNGLSSFDALDVVDLHVENGELNKLIITSKVQDEGTVMLGIGRNETCSIYLGETQVIDSGGNVAFTATSNGVIGTINNLKGSYGTSHPESVKAFRGNVMAFDIKNGVVWQYSSNGLFPISSYKMTKFFRRYAKRYVEAGSTFPIIGGIDPSSEEYLLSLGSVEPFDYVPTKLPTLTEDNEFVMYDGKSKTFGFKLGMQKYMTTYPWYSQLFEYIGVKMYGYSLGQLYAFADPSVPDNFFFQQQYTTKLMFISNSNPTKVKVYSNIAIEGNMAPLRVIFYSLDPYEQITDLVASEFVLKEGVFYANILRDRLSPNATGTPNEKLFKGNKMRSPALMVQLEFDTSVKKLQMKFVNIGYHISEGHST